MNPTILPQLEQLIGQTELFNLRKTTCLGDEKLYSNQLNSTLKFTLSHTPLVGEVFVNA